MRQGASAIIALLLLLTLPPAAPAASPGKNPLAGIPVKNPSYSGFNDAGWRTYLITGDQAVINNTNPLQIDIRSVRFTQFPGDGSATVQASITAPAASVFFDENRRYPRIAGRDSVHLVHENELDVTGEDWSYDHALQKLTINRNARIVYSNADWQASRSARNGMRNAESQTSAEGDAPRAPDTPQSAFRIPHSTTITADTLELVQNETDNTTIAVLGGNVTLTTTDDLRLTCDHLQVTATRLRDKDPALTALDKFQLLVATGNVRVTQGARTVTCGRAEVFPREDRVTLTENPVVADTKFGITAEGDPITLHRADRRIEGRNGRFTLPPLRNADVGMRNAELQTTAGHGSPPASDIPHSALGTPHSEDTVITAADYVMWETPDGLTHVRLDNNVTVAATDTRLTSDHLEVTATPEKQAAPDSAIPNPKLAPLHRLVATGNVHLTQAGREVTSGHAEVLPHEDKITLSQNPVLIDHATASTATADVFTLHRQERRLIAENNVSITSPPIRDLSATATKTKAADAPAQPGVNTVITGKTLTMWTAPDGISHAIFDNDVRLVATNLDLTCKRLTVDADPNKPVAPELQISGTGAGSPAALDPRLQNIASKVLLMIATGDVRFRQLAREASSGRAEIVPPEGRITLTENPIIIDRTNPADPVMITGEKMTLIRGQDDIMIEKPEITRAPAN